MKYFLIFNLIFHSTEFVFLQNRERNKVYLLLCISYTISYLVVALNIAPAAKSLQV